MITTDHGHHQCLRRGVVKEGLQKWCKQHAPTAVKAKREERNRKWQEQSDRNSLLWNTKDRLMKAVLEANPDSLPDELVAAQQAYKAARA